MGLFEVRALVLLPYRVRNQVQMGGVALLLLKHGSSVLASGTPASHVLVLRTLATRKKRGFVCSIVQVIRGLQRPDFVGRGFSMWDVPEEPGPHIWPR